MPFTGIIYGLCLQRLICGKFQALGVFQSTAMIAEKAEEEGGDEE